MTQQTAETIMQQIQADACTDTGERFVGAMQAGQHYRQGDLYVQLLGSQPEGLSLADTHQLAPGTTQGSRHTAEGAQVYTGSDSHPLLGPVVVASERWALRHPEHADVSLPSGCYRIGYQRDAAAEELERVRD